MNRKKRKLKRKIIVPVLIAFVILLGSPTYADTNITNCTLLNTSGQTYNIVQNITLNYYIETCMDITANNITLDCHNYLISAGTEYPQYGISVNRESMANVNITIKNCNVYNFEQANFYSNIVSNLSVQNSTAYGTITNSNFYFVSTNNSYFYNISAYNISNYGIDFEKAHNNIIDSVRVTDQTLDGIYIYRSSNNTLRNSIISNNTVSGIAIYAATTAASTSNKIYNNLINNTNNIRFLGTAINNNYWNTTEQTGTRIYSTGLVIGGNYWTNRTGNGYSDTCADADLNGICDNALIINSTVNNTDLLPLSNEYVAPVPETDPLENLTIAYTYCLTNTTLALINHTNEYGNITTSYLNCANGCDNTTTSCMPPKWQSNLIILAIVSIIIIGLYKLYRWV